MTADNPFSWSHPGTWPGPVRLWLALILASWIFSSIKPLWRWIQKRRSESWPTVQGKIESVQVREKKERWPSNSFWNLQNVHIVALIYSYVPAGQTCRGQWRKEFETKQEAVSFGRDLEGKPVTVSYDRQKSSQSTLVADSIAALLSSRAPVAETPRPLVGDLPPWAKPFLWPCAVVAGVGLGVSLWVHFGALAGRKVVPEPLFWMLHVGIFIVWFPAILIAGKRLGTARRKDYWNAVFRDSPWWLKYTVYVFMGYAVLNFAVFMIREPGNGVSGETPIATWRGFSGHWMAFYSAALAIFVAAIHTAGESNSSLSR